MAITLDGTSGITTPDVNSDGLTVDTTTLVVDEVNNRVGIGTSSPNNKLIVNGGIGSTAEASAGLTSGVLIDQTASTLGRILCYSATDSSLAFYTGSSSSASERARIDSSGNLLVGTTSSLGARLNVVFDPNLINGIATKPSANLTYAALDFQNSSGTRVGSVSVTSSATAYNTSSDYRLKENVVGVTGAAARVQQLNPVRFNFIANPDTTVDGFLAHEVQDVVPEAITGAKDAVETYTDDEGNEQTRPVYQGIDQSKLVPLLTAALQEALTKIETLEARVAALEAA